MCKWHNIRGPNFSSPLEIPQAPISSCLFIQSIMQECIGKYSTATHQDFFKPISKSRTLFLENKTISGIALASSHKILLFFLCYQMDRKRNILWQYSFWFLHEWVMLDIHIKVTMENAFAYPHIRFSVSCNLERN